MEIDPGSSWNFKQSGMMAEARKRGETDAEAGEGAASLKKDLLCWSCREGGAHKPPGCLLSPGRVVGLFFPASFDAARS